MQSDIRRRPEGALLRTYLAAAGMAPESIQKPLVGVVTAATQVFSEKPDARDLGSAAVSGVEAAGGIAVRWDTVRTPDLMSWGHADSYSFAWRDQLADFIESWSHQEALDGLVLVGDSSKTLAGMAMVAARLNIPAILVTAGASRWEFKQKTNGSSKKTEMSDPFELLTQNLFGKKRGDGFSPIDQFEACFLAQDNHSSYALDLVLEALGVCLPGMSTAPTQSVKRHELAYASGQRVVALIQGGLSFRRFLSLNAFNNAIRLNAALGGLVDVAVHLMALAHEAGVNITLDLFDRIARETPQVCRLGGVSDGKAPHRVEDLDRAGGVWAVMHAIRDKVLPTTTINGKGASELAKITDVKEPSVILTHRPYSKQSGVGVLKGNLAPKGAVFLVNQVLMAMSPFRGPVEIFESEIVAAKTISQGKFKKGAAIVVRGQGPKGGPGLRKLRVLPALMESRGLNKTVPLITDGRLPDTPLGIFISVAAPEAAAAGPLAILRSGDQIEIDIEKRFLGVRLTDMEIRLRLSRWQTPAIGTRRGFLERYTRLVSEANEGAVLK